MPLDGGDGISTEVEPPLPVEDIPIVIPPVAEDPDSSEGQPEIPPGDSSEVDV